jgi:hypothetical protein
MKMARSSLLLSVMGADGSNPHVVEVLRYHCAIDGSRAAWRPR